MTLSRRSWIKPSFALGATLWGAVACNDHPLEPLDKVVTAANNTEVSLPAKTKLDFLFLIDNSGSMCEEQANLVANFDKLSQFLFDELGEAADYRLAIVNTDLRTADAKGRFQDSPPGVSPNCEAEGVIGPDECDDLLVDPRTDRRWNFGPILKSGLRGNIGATREDLEHRFRCMATLGTGGDGFEKGLEAIRLALSCEGPNKDRFGACCVTETDAAGRVTKSTYDRNCALRLGLGGDEQAADGRDPEFLRPDAILVIVILSDEVDCSDPASNPKASRRAICKYGHTDGQDPDTFPDGFMDPELCPEGAAECYRRECGELDADKCYQARCIIDRGDNNNCEWFPDALTPVQDYVDFLKALKVDPNKNIIVASIVGPRAYIDLEDGSRIEASNVQGRPIEACWYYEYDGTPNVNVSQYDPTCCPNGRCTGGPAPTCDILGQGKAFSGRRYLQLSEAFGLNGIGCPPDEDESTPCIDICADDFKRPLELIKDKITKLLGHYCLEKIPQCLAPGAPGEPLHPCATAEERANLDNYKPTVKVRMQCIHTTATGGDCEVFVPLDNWEDYDREAGTSFIIEEDPSCPSQMALTLTGRAPPAGAEIFLEFRVDVSENAGPPQDGGAPAGDAGAFDIGAFDTGPGFTSDVPVSAFDVSAPTPDAPQ